MSTVISNAKAKIYFPTETGSVSKVQEVQNADSFSKVFNKTQMVEDTLGKEKAVKANDTKSKVESNTKSEDSESIQNHANIQKNKTSENLKEQTEEVKTMETSEEIEEAVNEAAGAMMESIAETFDVTVEEVEDVLETLGLTVLDLLNSENLTQVVLALNPECDAMTLMTNEELFADLKNLMNMAQELKGQIVQDFNLSEEEMSQLLDAMKDMEQMPKVEETAETEIPDFAEAVEEVTPDEVNVLVDVAEAVSGSEKENQTIGKWETTTDATRTQNVTEQQSETVVPKTENHRALENDFSETQKDASNTTAQNFSQNVLNQLAQAVENAEGTTTSYGVRGQDIMNQITEQIRVHVTQETTEMELQLHPASLGNVKVQIASTGGVLTAVFTTENEAVKTALESQLVQLKENFAQQGLKVESVEVNVSAQGFERSLDQQEQEQNRFQNNQGKKGNRRIRLSGMEEAGEVLTEEMTADDRIVADMMIRNGNTVDYMV